MVFEEKLSLKKSVTMFQKRMQDLEDGQIDEPEERDSIPSPTLAPPPGLYYLDMSFPFSAHI